MNDFVSVTLKLNKSGISITYMASITSTCITTTTTLASTTPIYLAIKPLSSNYLAPTQRHSSVIHCTPKQHQPLLPWTTPSPPQELDNLFDNISDNNKTDTVEATTQAPRSKWPMWLAGPAILLVTGAGPTLWLQVPAMLLGPNVVSLLALTGLDCVFNLGANLFLLMAHLVGPAPPSRPPPPSYKFWNLTTAAVGFIIPLAALLASQNGVPQFQPQLSLMGTLVVLGPYLLLVAVQAATEVLTWKWGSPVWPITPVVYETYRVVQLMRGLRLGADLGVPDWALHGIRGLVSWWVLVLGIQLMRVASLAGFAAGSDQDC